MIAITFLSIYAYNNSHEQKPSTPMKVYKDISDSEREVVQQNIRNAIQQQQHRRSKQNSEKTEMQDDVNPKSNMDSSNLSESVKQSLDNPIVEELVNSGSFRIIDHTGDNPRNVINNLRQTDETHNLNGINQAIMNRRNAESQSYTVEEFRSYLSELENSNNPEKEAKAQKLRNIYNRHYNDLI